MNISSNFKCQLSFKLSQTRCFNSTSIHCSLHGNHYV